MKTAILFATFFAFFLFFAPSTQAVDSECYTYSPSDPPYYYDTISACSAAGWDLCAEVEPGVYQGYYFDANPSGTSCTINSNSQQGTCDGSGDCMPTCAPSWSCGPWAPPDGDCGDTLNQTRTCTDSNSCGTTDGKPSESQTSVGTYCTSPVYGGWGACSDSYANVCDTSYSGTQSRTVTSYTCSNNVCGSSGSLPNETQNCSGSRTVPNTTVYGTVSCPSGSSGSCTQYCDGAGGYTACTPSCTETACTDSMDNDGDGNKDCNDSDCTAACAPADTTDPNGVTALTSTSHSTSIWKNDPTIDVSWTAATDNVGGSGIDGYSILWDTITNSTPDTTKDIEETTTTNTSPSLTSGSSHYFHIRSKDNAGYWQSGAAHLGPFYIDIIPPGAPIINSPGPGSVQETDFTVSAQDVADTGGSGLSTCHYGVKSNTGWTVPLGTTRTCGSVPNITVGSEQDCRDPGINKCEVHIYSRDVAGTDSPITMRTFSIAFLTYPSNTWQRLWYNDPKTNDFSDASFLGEGPGSNDKNGVPPVTSVTFETNWDGGQLYNTTANPTNNGTDKIGFKSSRTINFPTAGNYRFTIGSDDGIRLFLDEAPTPFCDQWGNGGYRTKDCDVSISAGNHKFQLDYYENTGNAKVSFTYGPSPCAKITSPLLEDIYSATVPTATGIKQCNITIQHIGMDDSDSTVAEKQNVSYETLTSDLNGLFPDWRKIGMDDNPSSGCQNNIQFTNAWNPGDGTLSVKSTKNAYDASHWLDYGYQISAANCVFKDAIQQSCTMDSEGSCNDPLFAFGERSVGSLQYWWPTFPLRVISAEYQYTTVECTVDAHCTPGSGFVNSDVNDSNKTYCNYGTFHNPNVVAHDTANFPANTCIDSVPPISKIIKIEDDYIPVHPPGFAPNIPPITGAHSAFLNADNNGNVKKLWYVLVEDTDNSSGSDSGLDSCFISINGLTFPRPCNGWTPSFSVGRDSAGAIHCVEEGNDKCKIKVWAQDKAGNKNDAALLERKVYEATASPPRLDEQKYNDFTAYPDGFNVFWLGVDWTAPTAQ